MFHLNGSKDEIFQTVQEQRKVVLGTCLGWVCMYVQRLGSLTWAWSDSDWRLPGLDRRANKKGNMSKNCYRNRVQFQHWGKLGVSVTCHRPCRQLPVNWKQCNACSLLAPRPFALGWFMVVVDGASDWCWKLAARHTVTTAKPQEERAGKWFRNIIRISLHFEIH